MSSGDEERGLTSMHLFQWQPISPGQVFQIAIILIGGTWAVSYFKNTQENVQENVATIQRTLDTNVATKSDLQIVTQTFDTKVQAVDNKAIGIDSWLQTRVKQAEARDLNVQQQIAPVPTLKFTQDMMKDQLAKLETAIDLKDDATNKRVDRVVDSINQKLDKVIDTQNDTTSTLKVQSLEIKGLREDIGKKGDTEGRLTTPSFRQPAIAEQ